MSMSPTARSLAYLKGKQFLAGVVERQTGPIKRDLFGMFDLLAIHPKWGTWAIQVTTGSNHTDRRRKVAEHPDLGTVLACGWQVYVWSWRKSAAGKWELREEQITSRS